MRFANYAPPDGMPGPRGWGVACREMHAALAPPVRQPWEFDVRVVGGNVVFPVAEQSAFGLGIRGYRLGYGAGISVVGTGSTQT